MRFTKICFLLSIVLAGSLAFAQQKADNIGLMVNLDSGAFSLSQDKLYRFNGNSAANYFQNFFNGNVSCMDDYDMPCSTASAPAAPAPDLGQSVLAAQTQVCTFLSGGTVQGTTYSQYISFRGRWGGKGFTTKTYTYYYDVVPQSSSVPALSGWDFIEDQPGSNGVARITLLGEIAHQQVKVVNGKNSHSYPMVVGPTQLLTDLRFYVNDLRAQMWIENIQNCAGCKPGQPMSLDFGFTANAGASGNAAMLRQGDARTVQNTDGDTANDDGGPTGSLLQKTILRPSPLLLPAGSYTLRVAGTSAGMNFDVTKILRVVTPETCSAY